MFAISEHHQNTFVNEAEKRYDFIVPTETEINKIALRLKYLKSKSSILNNVELSDYAKSKLTLA